MNAKRQIPEGFIVNRPIVWITLIAICAIVGISYANFNPRIMDDEPLNQPLYEVQQGPLTISISVAGTIQAREKEIIKNELEGQSTILYLIPEGTKVKTGDLLVELDASTLQDNLIDQSIAVQNAEAAYINARENLAIVENQTQSDIDQAQLTYDFAKLDLMKYNEGEYPKLRDERLSEIKLKEEELSQAQETLRWSEILYKEKYLSQTVYQKDELAANRTQIQLDLAKADLQLLEEYEQKRQVEQLTSDVKQAEMALERTKRQASANIVQASAELQAKLSEYDRQKGKLTKLEDQISKAKIYAPKDGLVVYATSVRQGWRGNDEPLDEGQQVRERQELIHLPTTSSYVAEVKIHESNLEKIRLNMPVVINIEALPGKTYYGRVGTIAPLPDAQSVFMSPDLKVYNTQIFIDGSGEDLRSGMSCLADIVIAQFTDATYVPVQSVLRIGGNPTVYVAKGRELEQRVVELGPDNNRMIQIAGGLSKGEKVLLTPPLSAAAITDEEKKQQLVEIPEMADVENPAADPRPVPQSQDTIGNGSSDAAPRSPEGIEGPPREGGRRNGGNRADMSPEEREAARQRFQNMTPEEREAMRQRFQNMSPEEREAMRRQRGGGEGRGGRGRGNSGSGDAGGEGGDNS